MIEEIIQQAFEDELHKIAQSVGIYSTKTPTPKMPGPMKKRPTSMGFKPPKSMSVTPAAPPPPTPMKIPGAAAGPDYL
jgi:hypothetical protein